MKTIRKKLVLWMIKPFNKFTNHFYKDPIQEGFIPKTVLDNNPIPGLNDRITYTSYMMSGLYPMTRRASSTVQRYSLVPFGVFKVVS
jgi:hypothetical protein